MPRGLLVFCLLSVSAWCSQPLEQAAKLYYRTDYEASLKILLAIPEKDGAVFDLIGKNQIMLGDFKKASETYEKAVAAEPSNSEYELWLGRAYGRRAENASPFSAPGLASKTRQHFEKAVALDPKNLDAIGDLFEYYLEAPGFLGGGLEKAGKTAERIAQLDPARGYVAQARIAEHRKDLPTAEERFRRAVEAAPKNLGHRIDLAKFLARQGRNDESEQSYKAAEQIEPDNPNLMYQRAETYIKGKRNMAKARELLKRYLSSALGPDDPPRRDAEKLLKQAGS